MMEKLTTINLNKRKRMEEKIEGQMEYTIIAKNGDGDYGFRRQAETDLLSLSYRLLTKTLIPLIVQTYSWLLQAMHVCVLLGYCFLGPYFVGQVLLCLKEFEPIIGL